MHTDAPCRSVPVTVLGAGGFIGRALVAQLRAQGREVRAVTRTGLPGLLAARAPAGHVIDCITAPAEAEIGLTARLLAELDLHSFLFLSATQVYARAEQGREDVALPVQPAAPGDLPSIVKLAGEALCLSDPRPTIRVARLSNVYGPGMGPGSFLGAILAEGTADGSVTLRQNLRSTNDYIAMTDVVPALLAIAERGGARLYNVASGVNTSHDALVGALNRLGWNVAVQEGAGGQRFPRIDITRLSLEFGAPRGAILADLPALADSMREAVAC